MSVLLDEMPSLHVCMYVCMARQHYIAYIPLQNIWV
jgi:hypothetical protein